MLPTCTTIFPVCGALLANGNAILPIGNAPLPTCSVIPQSAESFRGASMRFCGVRNHSAELRCDSAECGTILRSAESRCNLHLSDMRQEKSPRRQKYFRANTVRRGGKDGANTEKDNGVFNTNNAQIPRRRRGWCPQRDAAANKKIPNNFAKSPRPPRRCQQQEITRDMRWQSSTRKKVKEKK